MDFLTIVALSIGLSFDTFAVSISCGIIEKGIKFLQAARIATFFAFFQGFMPLLGWYLGFSIKDYIIQVDHWVAFGLLAIIGVKMIIESFKKESDGEFNPQSLKVILMMSFATTLDAFIVGITFAFMTINLFQTTVIIAGITFIAAMLGMLFGKNVGEKFGKKIEIAGGIILISLGFKILIEHLFY